MKTHLIKAVRDSLPPCHDVRTIETSDALVFIVDSAELCYAQEPLLESIGGWLLHADQREALIDTGRTEIHILAGR